MVKHVPMPANLPTVSQGDARNLAASGPDLHLRATETSVSSGQGIHAHPGHLNGTASTMTPAHMGGNESRSRLPTLDGLSSSVTQATTEPPPSSSTTQSGDINAIDFGVCAYCVS